MPASTIGELLVSRARSAPPLPEESSGLLLRPTLVAPTFSCPVPRHAVRLEYVEPPHTNFGVAPPGYQSLPWNFRSLDPESCVLVTSTSPTPPEVAMTLLRRCTLCTSLVSRLALDTRTPQMGPEAGG